MGGGGRAHGRSAGQELFDVAVAPWLGGVDQRANAFATRPPATMREGRLLCASSALSAPGAVIAWACGVRVFAAVSLLQVVLSVNYWRRPEWGVRRDLDVCCALLLSVAVLGHWCSKCATATPIRLCYSAAFLLWGNACREWGLKRATWVLWHVAFHTVLAGTNLVLVHGLVRDGLEM